MCAIGKVCLPLLRLKAQKRVSFISKIHANRALSIPLIPALALLLPLRNGLGDGKRPPGGKSVGVVWGIDGLRGYPEFRAKSGDLAAWRLCFALPESVWRDGTWLTTGSGLGREGG